MAIVNATWTGNSSL